MRRTALAVLLGFMVSAGVWASEDGTTAGAADSAIYVPETMGPGAFLVGADTGRAVIIAGPFCDQVDIICDARCTKLAGAYTCVGGSSGF